MLIECIKCNKTIDLEEFVDTECPVCQHTGYWDVLYNTEDLGDIEYTQNPIFNTDKYYELERDLEEMEEHRFVINENLTNILSDKTVDVGYKS